MVLLGVICFLFCFNIVVIRLEFYFGKMYLVVFLRELILEEFVMKGYNVFILVWR